MGGQPTKHDSVVTSHSIDQGAARHLRRVKKGELDLRRVQEWIGTLLEEHGDDIYRMKGVLAIAHAKQRFVFHAVHMLMDGTFEEPWADGEARESKLVFIGRCRLVHTCASMYACTYHSCSCAPYRNLDPASLNAGFDACLDSPKLREQRLADLRFKIGDVVECNTGCEGWVVGEVIALMYRDDGMPPGLVAPYQVRLEDGECIYAPADEDGVVRAPQRRSPRKRRGSRRGSAGGDSAGGSAGPSGSTARHGHEHGHEHGHADGHEHGHVHDEHCGHDHEDEEEEKEVRHNHGH